MTSTEASGAARESASLGREALAFLERRGFTLRPDEPSARLAYDSSRVQLRLRRDPRGYDFDTGISLVGQAEWFTLEELAALGEVDLRIGIGAAKTAESTTRAFERIAALLAGPARRALDGDEVLFGELRRRQRHASRKLMLELHDEPLRREAQAAWRARDYARAAELLATLRAPTPVERRKLEYARARGRQR